MTKQRVLRIGVLTVLTFSLQAASSPAARALQGMRAVQCCAQNCDHPKSFTAASRCGCCQIAAAPEGGEVVTASKPDLSAPNAVAIANVDSVIVSGTSPAVLTVSTVSARAAPVFLLTLHILL